MKEEIKVPTMGESITEAVVGSCLKTSGSKVHKEEEILELETEKVNQVLYAPCSGTLNWSIREGDTVRIGDLLGQIDSENVEEKEREIKRVKKKVEVMQDESVGNLHKAPEVPLPSPLPIVIEKGLETRQRMTKIRQTIGNRLVKALHSTAMLTTFNEVDMSAIITLRSKYKENFIQKYGAKLGFMSFFVKAVVEGLKTYSAFNSYIDKEEIVKRNYYAIGIAIGTKRGLVVPVVRDCDTLSFAQIESQIIAYANKAREGRLAIEDLEGGGFTITNGGVYGSLLSTPILNPPQVGILGMHKIMKRPVVVNDEIVICPMMYLALSYDHRIVDGKEAVTFLIHIKEILENPSSLILIGTDGEI